MSRVPILVILGSTGTGKSRLAIELAQKFAGEIISADSMQVYKGLDIITAKVTEEERSLASHHMLDFVDPLHNYCVIDFKKAALPIYDDNEHSNETLHQKLASVDPEMARRLHPNNRRKIIRSLEVFENHGTTHSEILKHQRTAGGCGLGGPLRFPNSLILWLKCDQKILDIRLDRRVDSMLEAGLVSELLGFHERYNQERLKINALPDYTKGIFQSIGFKEFHNYLILPDTEKRSEQGIALLRQGISDLKLVTRRYARRQQKWIMNRFIKRIDRQVPPVYDLDCTNIEEWNSKVLESAIEIINAKLRGDVHTQKPLNGSSLDEKFSDSSNEESHWCEICQKILIGELQWKSHKNGAKHKKMEIKKRKVMSHHINENKISFIC
ncbi:tRNA dimethylallyltransferase isoform X4 [Cotesia typhae]|uniref:tRNA dimethylallyltransferase isoform X4 n=1 Tax=Cotesia typhae TaxID=2053667 RepID=UPI003D688E3B